MAPLRVALAPLADRIRAAFVYGSIAKGRHRATSVVDLMIIADKLDYAGPAGGRGRARADRQSQCDAPGGMATQA